MTISAVSETGDLSAGDKKYQYGFLIVNEDHLRAVVTDPDENQTTLTKTLHYTVSGVSSRNGGSLTLVNGTFDWLEDGNLKTGWTIKLSRVVPLAQQSDFKNQERFYPASFESSLDYQMMATQQQDREIRDLRTGELTKLELLRNKGDLIIFANRRVPSSLIDKSSADSFAIGNKAGNSEVVFDLAGTATAPLYEKLPVIPDRIFWADYDGGSIVITRLSGGSNRTLKASLGFTHWIGPGTDISTKRKFTRTRTVTVGTFTTPMASSTLDMGIFSAPSPVAVDTPVTLDADSPVGAGETYNITAEDLASPSHYHLALSLYVTNGMLPCTLEAANLHYLYYQIPDSVDIGILARDLDGRTILTEGLDLTALEKDVASLGEDVTGLDRDVTDVETRVAGLESEVEGVEEDVAENATAINLSFKTAVKDGRDLVITTHGGAATRISDIFYSDTALVAKTDKSVKTIAIKGGTTNILVVTLQDDTSTEVTLPMSGTGGASSFSELTGQLQTAQLASKSVTEAKLTDAIVRKLGQIANLANQVSDIADGTTKTVPADGSVTHPKLGAEAVEAENVKRATLTKRELSSALRGEVISQVVKSGDNLEVTDLAGSTTTIALPTDGDDPAPGGDADPNKFLTYAKLLPNRDEVDTDFQIAIQGTFFLATETSSYKVPFIINFGEANLGNNRGRVAGFNVDRSSGLPVIGKAFHRPDYNDVISSPDSGVRFPNGAGPGSTVQPIPFVTTQRGPYIVRRDRRNPDDSLNTGTEVGVDALTWVWSGVMLDTATLSPVVTFASNNARLVPPIYAADDKYFENAVINGNAAFQTKRALVVTLSTTLTSTNSLHNVRFSLTVYDADGNFVSSRGLSQTLGSDLTQTITLDPLELAAGEAFVIGFNFAVGTVITNVDISMEVDASETVTATFTGTYSGIQNEFLEMNQEILEFNGEVDYSDQDITNFNRLLAASLADPENYKITEDQYVGTEAGQVVYQRNIMPGGRSQLVMAPDPGGSFFAINADGAIVPVVDFTAVIELDNLEVFKADGTPATATADAVNMYFAIYEVESDGRATTEVLAITDDYLNDDSVSFIVSLEAGKAYKVFEDNGAMYTPGTAGLNNIGAVNIEHNEYRQIWHPSLIGTKGFSRIIPDKEKAIEAEFHTLQEDVEGLHSDVQALQARPTNSTSSTDNSPRINLDDVHEDPVLRLPRADKPDSPDLVVLEKRSGGGATIADIRTAYPNDAASKQNITSVNGTTIDLPYGTGVTSQQIATGDDNSELEILQPLPSTGFIIRGLASRKALDSSNLPVMVTVKMFLNGVEDREFSFNLDGVTRVNHPGDSLHTTSLVAGDIGFGAITNLKVGDKIKFTLTFDSDPTETAELFYGELEMVATNRQHIRSIEDVPEWHSTFSAAGVPFTAYTDSPGGDTFTFPSAPDIDGGILVTAETDADHGIINIDGAFLSARYQDTLLTIHLTSPTRSGRGDGTRSLRIYEFVDSSSQLVLVETQNIQNLGNNAFLAADFMVSFEAEVGKRYVLVSYDAQFATANVRIDSSVVNYPDFTRRSLLSSASTLFSSSIYPTLSGISDNNFYAITKVGGGWRITLQKTTYVSGTITFTAGSVVRDPLSLGLERWVQADANRRLPLIAENPSSLSPGESITYTLPPTFFRVGDAIQEARADLASGSFGADDSIVLNLNFGDPRYPDGLPRGLLIPRNFVQNPHLFEKTSHPNRGEFIIDVETTTIGGKTYTGFSQGHSLGNEYPDFGKCVSNLGASSIKSYFCSNVEGIWEITMIVDSQLVYDLDLARIIHLFLSQGGNILTDSVFPVANPNVRNPNESLPEQYSPTGFYMQHREIGNAANTLNNQVQIVPRGSGSTVNTTTTHKFQQIVGSNVFARFVNKQMAVQGQLDTDRSFILHPLLNSYTAIDGDHPSQARAWAQLGTNASRLNKQKSTINSVIDAAITHDGDANAFLDAVAALAKL